DPFGITDRRIAQGISGEDGGNGVPVGVIKWPDWIGTHYRLRAIGVVTAIVIGIEVKAEFIRPGSPVGDYIDGGHGVVEKVLNILQSVIASQGKASDWISIINVGRVGESWSS